LIYRPIPVFIDGRADLYGDQKVAEYYAIADVLDAAKTTQLLQDHGIAWTIFPPNQVMVSYLNSRPEWQKVYEDSTAVVHVKH
jgi:hypothetical protein